MLALHDFGGGMGEDYTRYDLSSDPIIGKLNDSTYCGHENFRSVSRIS